MIWARLLGRPSGKEDMFRNKGRNALTNWHLILQVLEQLRSQGPKTNGEAGFLNDPTPMDFPLCSDTFLFSSFPFFSPGLLFFLLSFGEVAYVQCQVFESSLVRDVPGSWLSALWPTTDNLNQVTMNVSIGVCAKIKMLINYVHVSYI